MVNIFEKVLRNIEESIEKYPRVVDVVLYYPEIGFTYYLDHQTSFNKVQKIKNLKYRLNNRECFEVYRYTPE